MRGFKIRSVQPSVRDCAELVDEVFALDVTDEAVCISVTEMQAVAERRQQTIVVELVHNELRKFEYGAADGNWLREDRFARTFSTIARSALMINKRM